MAVAAGVCRLRACDLGRGQSRASGIWGMETATWKQLGSIGSMQGRGAGIGGGGWGLGLVRGAE